MYQIRRSEDVEEVREAHTLAFPDDKWVGDDHEYWIARDARGAVAGFCSAIILPETNGVFLSRAAVVKHARGAGLQRRMIRTRVTWAKRQGVKHVLTYVSNKNYLSMVNLLRCGFRFCNPEVVPDRWSKTYHFMLLNLSDVEPNLSSVKLMLKDM